MRTHRPRLLSLILFCLIPIAVSAQLITFVGSNQTLATAGFETNAFDWMLNPLDFGKLQSSTLAFSLDGDGYQFGATTAGYGFRGGYAWLMDGFSPILFLDYHTAASSTTKDEESNTAIDYSGYDEASGSYGTVTRSVAEYTSNLTPAQSLMAQFGGKLDGAVNFDVRFEWMLDTVTRSYVSYTDTYSNTTSPTDDTLSAKGTREDFTSSLRNDSTDNALALEGEVGLTFGALSSVISLGTGLMNWDFTAPSSQDTNTYYGIATGIDPTVRDKETDTIYSGAYYTIAGTTSAIPSFGMNTNAPNYLPYVPISLDSMTTWAFDETFKVKVPFAFAVNIYPDASTVYTNRTVLFDDADANNRETSREDATTTNTISYGRNLSTSVGGLVHKSFTRDSATLHLGAGLDVAYDGWAATRTSTYSVHTQVDGNADADYTDAGTDTDTTYVQSGYEITSSNDEVATTVWVPLAVSYSPASALTFHAGTVTSLTATCTMVSSLATGSGYMYETYTDNLVTANSYAQRLINGSSSQSTPASIVEWSFAFTTSATFGVTLQVAEGFVIDAVATTSTGTLASAGFSSFSLMGTYSF